MVLELLCCAGPRDGAPGNFMLRVSSCWMALGERRSYRCIATMMVSVHLHMAKAGWDPYK